MTENLEGKIVEVVNQLQQAAPQVYEFPLAGIWFKAIVSLSIVVLLAILALAIRFIFAKSNEQYKEALNVKNEYYSKSRMYTDGDFFFDTFFTLWLPNRAIPYAIGFAAFCIFASNLVLILGGLFFPHQYSAYMVLEQLLSK